MPSSSTISQITGTLVCVAAIAVSTYVWSENDHGFDSVRLANYSTGQQSFRDSTLPVPSEHHPKPKPLDDDLKPSDKIPEAEASTFLSFLSFHDHRLLQWWNHKTRVRRVLFSDSFVGVARNTGKHTFAQNLCTISHVTQIAASAQVLEEVFGPSDELALSVAPPIIVFDDNSGIYYLEESSQPVQPPDNGPDLELVLLRDDVRDLFPGINRSASRITKISIIPSDSFRPLNLLDLSSISSFPSLTHLALPAKFTQYMISGNEVGIAALFESFVPTLERIVFLTSGGMEARHYDKRTKDVLLSHIFSNRKHLVLPCFPTFHDYTEDDAYIQHWEKGGDIWMQAEVYTAREGSKLLRNLMKSGLRISSAEELKSLYEVLKLPQSAETCSTPLKDEIPAKMMHKLVIDSHILPADVGGHNASTIISVVLSTLANHQGFEELVVASLWINAMDMVPSARWPWQLTISQWDSLADGRKWPEVRPKPLLQVNSLVFRTTVPASCISWGSFPTVVELSFAAHDVDSLAFILSKLSTIRKYNLQFKKLTLLSSHRHHPKAADVKKCKTHDVELTSKIVC